MSPIHWQPWVSQYGMNSLMPVCDSSLILIDVPACLAFIEPCPPAMKHITSLFIRHVREHAQHLGWQPGHGVVRKPHIDRLETPADNLTALVQPGIQYPRLRVVSYLLDPAE